MSDIQVERKILIKEATKLGSLWKRGDKVKIWDKKYAILNKGYIYFLDHNKDEKVSSYYWIKKANITELEEN